MKHTDWLTHGSVPVNDPGHPAENQSFNYSDIFPCQLLDQALSDWLQVNREAIQPCSEVICWISATGWLELAELIREEGWEVVGGHAEGLKQTPCARLEDGTLETPADLYICPVSIPE